MLGATILAIALVALMGGLFSQTFLNASARNLTLGMNDATRVLEQIRQQNTSATEPCLSTGIPSAVPSGTTSWNTWLERQGTTQNPGKSIAQPTLANRNRYELIVVTCQDGSSAAPIPPYCGPNQIGTGEWRPWTGGGAPTGGSQAANTSFNTLRISVAVGWQQGQRALGGTTSGQEFTYTPARGAAFEVGPDRNLNGVIESQAMLTTLVSCR